MKIAVLSDIHGNYIALAECIRKALEKNADRFIFLGDYVGDMPYPQKTMNLLYEIKGRYECYFIKGNKEDYWLNYKAGGEKGWQDKSSTSGALLYTYNNLRERDLEFFSKLPISTDLEFKGLPTITICHGSPKKTKDKLFADAPLTFSTLENMENELLLSGHIHRRTYVEHNGKRLINGGSVGVPLGSNGMAQFVILEGENGSWKHEFVDVEYDVEKVINEFDESGMKTSAPYWCEVTSYLIRSGKKSHATVLARVMELCKEETGVCNWPDIPEKYWEQAVKEFGI